MKFVFAALLTLLTTCTIFANTPDLMGVYDGTWTGDSTGKLSITIKKDDKGAAAVDITYTPDGGGETNTVKATTVDIVDSKVKMTFENPGGDIVITLDTTITGNEMTGTYSVKSKGDGSVVDKGTIKTTKK